ncbi:hypothetical protein E2562_010012 [Oryza meyeriana var. granulata]|uniref:Uncharacterized protein n=1 Tax=Oryza meyeriana var. granulata TaxID=110450 RepID=A0A6G1EHV3_9ORYZ|nr:hypothetical protein E2562_010012 [Oryza meyeriana var. granulata]
MTSPPQFHSPSKLLTSRSIGPHCRRRESPLPLPSRVQRLKTTAQLLLFCLLAKCRVYYYYYILEDVFTKLS